MAEVLSDIAVTALDSSISGIGRSWHKRRSKTLLVVASVFTFTVTWFIAALLGVPAERGFDGSLLAQQAIFSAIVAVVVSIGINAIVLRAVLGRAMQMEIGFALAIGLLAFSTRGGSMIELMQYHGLGVYVVLIIETLFLYGCLASAWFWLRLTSLPQSDDGGSDLQQKLTALAVTAVVMIVLMHLFCESAAKKQVIGSVLVSSFVGSMVAFSFLGEMSIEFYLLAPGAVALIGYIMALLGGADVLGQPTQVLAYPLPLEYVGAGVAGALLGYWTALGWKQENVRGN